MPQKIFIIGSSGSGKSYLANILSDKYGLPHFDLDDIFREVKYSKRRGETEKKQELSKILKTNDKRIIEGIFFSFIEEGLLQADQIIWLDIHPNILTCRILKRYIIEKREGESLKTVLGLIRWTRGYRKQDGYFYKHKELLDKNNLKYIYIKNKNQFNRYLKYL